MRLNIFTAQEKLPVKNGYMISATITNFKGRKDVEVHLYRPEWDEEEARSYDWSKLLGDPVEKDMSLNPQGSRKVLMESFTVEERDMIVEYLKERYISRLSAITSRPLDFPVPLGLTPLCEIPEDEDIRRIRFDEIPNYSLRFPVHGIYVLSQHEPVKGETEDSIEEELL